MVNVHDSTFVTITAINGCCKSYMNNCNYPIFRQLTCVFHMPGNICNYIWVYSTYRAIYFPADSNFKLQKRCTISYFFFFGEPSQGNLRHPCPFYASVSLSLSLSRSLVLSILGTGFSFWRAPCGLVLSLRNPVPSTPSTQYPVTTLQDPQSLELGSFCARKHEKRNAIWHTRDSN